MARSPLEEVSSFQSPEPSFTGAGKAVGEIAAGINLARVTFNRLHTSLWSRHKISRWIYEPVVGTIWLFGRETGPLRIEDGRRLEAFDNDCLRHILGRRRLDGVTCFALRRQLHLWALPPGLLQR